MTRRLAACLAAFALAILVLAAPCAQAQVVPTTSAPATPVPESDHLGRDTPRGLMFGYLQAVSTGNYEMAGRYIDMPSSSESFRLKRGAKLAQDLQTLLDRAGSLNENWTISAQPRGNAGDGLDEGFDLLGRIASGDEDIPILAERVTTDAGAQIWLISSQTVEAIPELLAESHASVVDRSMPVATTKIAVRNVPLSHMLYALGALSGLLAIFYAILRLAEHALTRIVANTRFEGYTPLIAAVRRPLVVLMAVGATMPILEASGISVILRGHLSPALDIARWGCIGLIVIKIANQLLHGAIRRSQERGYGSSASALTLVRRGVNLFILFAIVLVVLDALGVNPTAGFAALGVGSLAIALGSKSAIEHFVGSLTVVGDRIVRIGDFVRFGTTLGTVEDIGIRSTKLRTIGRTLVTVPNGAFSSVEIENFTARDKFLFKHDFDLRPTTSRSQMISCLEGIREILIEDDAVDPDPARARLIGMPLGAPRIEVFAYVLAADFNEFLMHQENLLLRIFATVESAGTAIAIPATEVHRARRREDAGTTLKASAPTQLPLFGT